MSVSRLKPAYRVVWTMCNLLFSECVTVSPLSHRPFWYFHLTSHNVCLEGSVVCRLSSNPSKYVSVFSSGGDQVFMFPWCIYTTWDFRPIEPTVLRRIQVCHIVLGGPITEGESVSPTNKCRVYGEQSFNWTKTWRTEPPTFMDLRSAE
jgi:hypothetical protein